MSPGFGRWRFVAPASFAALALAVGGGSDAALAAFAPRVHASGEGAHVQATNALAPDYLDKLLAPVALYPDQLLAQMLLCAGDARKVGELSAWLKQTKLTGSELQQAAQKAGFEPSFVALALFPQVVELMAGNPAWTSQLGGAFAVDRSGVFDSVQRLRKQGQAAGNLKSTPQQTVETRQTQGGEQVIVIEPANPQVVYVPQYNPQVVYTQPATSTTTVIVQEDDDDDEAAAALVGFTAGIVIGAAVNNNYYYGPYGWHGGGAYMYNDGWDDWYDDREDAREAFYENRDDAREDYADHREDMAGERSERAENARENRQERSPEAQAQREQQRSERQAARGTSETQAQRTQAREARTSEASASSASASSASASSQRSRSSAERSGTRSDAFSNYSSSRSTRSESSRGQRSRSRSGGGGRSRSR